MEIMRNGYCTVKSFVSSVIEWRSAAAAPYLMFINSAFWWGVFYLDKETQLRLLVSCAAGIFGWDILLSSTYERSILFHIFTWPMRSVLRTTSVAMALTSAQFLYRTEFEKACWTAYGAAILEKIKKDLLRIKTTTENIYVVTVGKLCAGKNAVLDVIYSAAFNIENFISQTIYEFRKIVEPIQNAFRRVIQFLQYWLCAHWWPSLKSWFIQHVMSRLQLLFNYFCFGIVYVSCGYWVDPFVAFLSKHFKRFYAYFERSVLNPVKIWIRRQVDETLEYMKQMMHNLAIKVRDSILWPFFILLVSLMNKICVHLYRILLQPVVDVLYKKYKICEDYLLIYCLGPVCKFFVDHIPDRSPFCDDTDTELADLLPPGFSEEESDAEETSEKSSLPNRSLTPLTEDERDFVRGLEFPNLDTSDSSEAEFALKPKSKFRKSLRKKPKAHPKDPAPSVCNDELISTAYEVQNDKDKRKRSSSNSSHSGMTNESVFSSSIQNASDDADLQNLNALDSELEDHPRSESLADIVEIKKSKEISKDKKQNMDQKKIKEIEVFDTGQVSVNAAALTTDLDDSFEVLDK
ncbi:unnamed protein product [Onchocerca ochengi]|uniref:Bestrophin homolog n=1 Tax=Onchocerca ochengi TaxID=42157 RepID=A0A182EBM4_ONCOC|nr:unnamed protein product [Onchocerca ochengi]